MPFKPLNEPQPREKRGGFKPIASIQPAAPTNTAMENMGPVDKFLIGAGSGMTDMAQGVEQLFGADNRNDILEKQRIDQAGGLSDSGYGTAGNVVGKIALAAPTMFIPGANTAMGATLIGGGIGLAEPTTDESVVKGKLKNATLGAAFGRGGHEVGKRVGGYLAGRMANRGAQNQILKGANSVKDATLDQGRKLGYKVNPVQANPSMSNQILEGYAGKITTAQKVAEHNQKITNEIARKSLGMADDAPITPEAIKTIRDNHGRVYSEISGIKDRFVADDQYLSDLDEITRNTIEMLDDFPEWKDAGSGIQSLVDSILVDDMGAKSASEVVKRLRQQSSAHFKSYDDPAKRALAFAEKKAANALDSLIGRNLERLGRGDLHTQWHTAREGIAKTYTVEKALNEGSGNVVAHKLARAYSKGDPLTGELKDAAKYAQTFDRATQEIKSSMPGISPLDASVATIGAASGGFPGLVKAMAGTVVGRPIARNLITSSPWQKTMTTPQYRLHAQLVNAMKKAPSAAAVAAPSIYLGQQ